MEVGEVNELKPCCGMPRWRCLEDPAPLLALHGSIGAPDMTPPRSRPCAMPLVVRRRMRRCKANSGEAARINLYEDAERAYETSDSDR
jgi:hypothetical protein